MPRRRFSKEQQESIAKARVRQKRACAKGNHHWWPEYGWDEESQRPPIEPQYWTVEQRFPMPDWDGKSLICSARKCGARSCMKNVPLKTQKRMRRIIKDFMENTISMRKNYLADKKLNRRLERTYNEKAY